MKFEQLCYTWIHGSNYAGSCADGWGVLQTSNQEEQFLKSALEVVTNRSASLDPAYTEYFEYQERFHCHVYLGVKKLETLAQMGGADNNRLIQLFVPRSDSLLGLYQVAYEAEPVLEPGIIPCKEFEPCAYDYQKLLKKYKLIGDAEADARFAVLIALQFLSYVSEEWKHVIFPVRTDTRSLTEAAREITWLLGQLLPVEIFGRKRSELKKRLGYQVKGKPEGSTLVFMPAGNGTGTLKEHYFSLDAAYDWSQDISREVLDRKVEGCGSLFYCLAKKAQKSPEAMLQWLEVLLRKQNCFDIATLNDACDSSELMLEQLSESPESKRYITAGLELLHHLKEAGADAGIAKQMLEFYETDSILAKELATASSLEPGTQQKLNRELEQYLAGQYEASEQAKGNLEGNHEPAAKPKPDVLSKNEKKEVLTQTAEKSSLDHTMELENLFENSTPREPNHSDTAARMEALLNKEKEVKAAEKKGDLLSKLFRKK